ncbi:hypothetical protein SAMN05421678_102122 [Actinopolymorpha cephalotaxi]|uniref:Uncharacterized protein n=1 Tax=Actinopolymorpha cephalotaxi TaxID=504797 RepID=A0A1I2LHR9_9ACTN|nr:hypothetical protein [Actinopolymorpha cephalotaxi]NYH84906.1 hypothetical protein [Actinopolymorpha cephalotaxi]SFF78098.1 hypothetical protein SAMN05421678_102122 [Actinopolymorpha cephalotaxi]
MTAVPERSAPTPDHRERRERRDRLAGVTFSQALRWHRPLMLLAVAMAVVGVVGVVGLFADDRVITGMPIWAKPTKFAVSILIYSVTWAWLISQLRHLRRTAWWMGTVAATGLAVEMVVIVGQVLRGTTSHFNETTPLNAALWKAMGISIVFVWVATLVVCVILFRNPGQDRARALAVRAGALVALLGMAIGFLMVVPTAQQLASDSDIMGAHTVGLADGGAGLPLLGWSTVGGDLRIPHFVGMHALQLIPLAALALEFLARGLPVLRVPTVRLRLLVVIVAAYVAELALLTWQALRGQSIMHPDVLTDTAAVVVLVWVVAGVLMSLRAGRGRTGAGDVDPGSGHQQTMVSPVR